LEQPGAYYQRILLTLLEDHQAFVPRLGEPSAEEVYRLALQSLRGAELYAGGKTVVNQIRMRDEDRR